jgi:hypothetical protein
MALAAFDFCVNIGSSLRGSEATKQSRLSLIALVWIGSQGEREAFVRLPLAISAPVQLKNNAL